MNAATEAMSAELNDELAASERRLVDPRQRPLRFHNLKAMAKSAAHCLESFQESEERDSLAQRIGSGTHAMLFGQEVTRYPGPVRRGKAWETFRALHPYAVILSAKEYLLAQNLATALRNHREASRLLFHKDAVHERTILWEQDGRRRRSTPDVLIPGVAIVDLKSAKDGEPERFKRDATRYAYHAQLADYRDAVEADTGQRLPCFIVAVEKVRPYAVTVLHLTDRTLEKGQAMVRGWFERFRVCEDSNAWPNYCETAVEFDLPDEDEFGGLVFPDDEDSAVPTSDESED